MTAQSAPWDAQGKAEKGSHNSREVEQLALEGVDADRLDGSVGAVRAGRGPAAVVAAEGHSTAAARRRRDALLPGLGVSRAAVERRRRRRAGVRPGDEGPEGLEGAGR